MIKLEELNFEEFKKMLSNNINIKEDEINIIIQAISDSKFDISKNPYIYSAILGEINEKPISEIVIGNKISPKIVASATKKSVEYAKVIEVQRQNELLQESNVIETNRSQKFEILKENDVKEIKSNYDKIFDMYRNFSDEERKEFNEQLSKFIDIEGIKDKLSKGGTEDSRKEEIDDSLKVLIMTIANRSDFTESKDQKKLIKEYIAATGMELTEEEIDIISTELSLEKNRKGMEEFKKSNPKLFEKIKNKSEEKTFEETLEENIALLESTDDIPTDLAEALSFSSELLEMTKTYEGSKTMPVDLPVTDFEFDNSLFEISEIVVNVPKGLEKEEIEVGGVPQPEGKELTEDGEETKETVVAVSPKVFSLMGVIKKSSSARSGEIKGQQDITKVLVTGEEEKGKEAVTVGI